MASLRDDRRGHVNTNGTMIIQWMTRMICAVALLFIGFAHQVPASANTTLTPYELAEYVLPDGSLPVICVAEKASGAGTHEKAHMHGCEACRSGASTLMPAPARYADPLVQIESTSMVSHEGQVLRLCTVPPNARPRAPPEAPISA